MSVVLWLVTGLVFGSIASLIAGKRVGRVSFLVIGGVGALAGGFLFSLFGGLGMTGNGMLAAAIGSSMPLVLYLGLSRRRT
jgi:uncharacterized membrane protein YeaQ/YmgE (transglycosylase-associated protein family)